MFIWIMLGRWASTIKCSSVYCTITKKGWASTINCSSVYCTITKKGWASTITCSSVYCTITKKASSSCHYKVTEHDIAEQNSHLVLNNNQSANHKNTKTSFSSVNRIVIAMVIIEHFKRDRLCVRISVISNWRQLSIKE